MTPEHRGGGPEPAGLSSLVSGTPKDREEPAPGHEPARHPSEQSSVLFARHMDERVECDDRRKRSRRKVNFGEVRAEELSLGDKSTSPADLHVRDIHAGDAEPPCERSCRRNPCAAPQVEDLRTAVKILDDGPEPGLVVAPRMSEDIRWTASGAIPVGSSVPALSDGGGPAGPLAGRNTTSRTRHNPPTHGH